MFLQAQLQILGHSTGEPLDDALRVLAFDFGVNWGALGKVQHGDALFLDVDYWLHMKPIIDIMGRNLVLASPFCRFYVSFDA